MKKILSFVAAIMIATTATAQTAMELARQQQELNAVMFLIFLKSLVK